MNYCTPGMSGFDEWFSTEFAVATWDPYDPENSHVRRGQLDPRALYWRNGKVVPGPLTGCDSKLIVDQAIPFIRQATQAGKPFFTVVWFHAPHAPVVGGPEFRAMYADLSENQQHYNAVVTALDVQVGRLRAPWQICSCLKTRWSGSARITGPKATRKPAAIRKGPRGRCAAANAHCTKAGCACPACWSGQLASLSPGRWIRRV